MQAWTPLNLSGGEVISLAEPTYDLAILDIKLPDMTGDEMAKTIRERMIANSIVLMTCYPELSECIDSLSIGIQEILIKPISPDEVLSVAGEALSGNRVT